MIRNLLLSRNPNFWLNGTFGGAVASADFGGTDSGSSDSGDSVSDSGGCSDCGGAGD